MCMDMYLSLPFCSNAENKFASTPAETIRVFPTLGWCAILEVESHASKRNKLSKDQMIAELGGPYTLVLLY
jgi:hypothetical protein